MRSGGGWRSAGLRMLLAGAWLLGNLLWLRADRIVRDGDEEGHVGAAELLLAELSSEGGAATFLRAAVAGDLGEYPPLYPALVGAWWWLLGGGQPGRPAVRAINLLWPLLCAAAAGRLAPPGRRTVAFGLTLLVPGLCGLGRHFMPEGALAAAITLAMLAAGLASRRPGWGAAAWLGLACGGALLVKQTAALYLAGPLLWALPALRHRVLLTAAVALVVAGPWYLERVQDQGAYLLRSLPAEEAPAGLLATALYYPALLGWSELGPALAILLVGGAWAGWRRAEVRLGLCCLGAGLLLLTLTPRRYPRLLAPLLPAAALVAASGVSRREVLAAGAGLGAGWVVAASTTWRVPELRGLEGVDAAGCPQRWLRPPVGDDLGLARVAAAVAIASREGRGGVVVVWSPPEIPCEVQATHPWVEHLSPYLRRAGLEAEVWVEPSALPAGAREVVEVRWRSGRLADGFQIGEGVVD